MKFAIVVFYALVLQCSCRPRGQNQGAIIIHNLFYGVDSNSNPPLDIKYKVLFDGNQSIQEVPILIFAKDSTGDKTTAPIRHYSYLDAGLNICYNYTSLSDTAKILDRFQSMDSVQQDGGKNFYSNEKFEYNKSSNLPDTTITGIRYGRIRLDKVVNGNNGYLILYYRCDKKDLPIKIFKHLSDSIGCPIVRDDSYINGRLFMIRQFEFLSDTLSANELKIFAAWQKNAQKQ